jgi:hypothetical protein
MLFCLPYPGEPESLGVLAGYAIQTWCSGLSRTDEPLSYVSTTRTLLATCYSFTVGILILLRWYRGTFICERGGYQ